ncbi:MAG: chromate transporter [Treponema sp.]|jgi:chromate transporter|nr:chromate transporter [Treponema sp.]
MSLLSLFGTFFYVGLFTIGGGLVAITLMYKPIVESGLISAELFYNMLAVSESTPGPIGINMATYVGYTLYGIPGALVTTAGQVLPSLIIITIIARYVMRFHQKPLVQAAFVTLRPAVSGMIAVAAAQVLFISVVNIQAFRDSGLWYRLVNVKETVFYAASLALLAKTKLHPVAIVAAGAVFGLVFL